MTNPRDVEEISGTVNPDPTILTTKLIDRAVGALREVLECRLEGSETNSRTRLEAMDKAIILLQTTNDKFPCLIDVKVKHLRDLHDERFAGIVTQFKERDVRVEQTARDTKVAVDAALQAAEKAVGKQNEAFAVATAKSEAATTKQIDQIGVLIATTNKATDEKIDDMKTRFGSMESVLASINGRTAGISSGTDRTEKRHDVNMGWVVAGVTILIAIIGLLLSLTSKVSDNTHYRQGQEQQQQQQPSR